MWWIAVIVIFALVAGIVYFSLITTSGRKKTREQFLKELADSMEGSVEPLHDPLQPNAFRVIFNFEGEKFIYEDIEELSFREKLFKGYLKCQTPSSLDLYVTEKEKSNKIIQPELQFSAHKNFKEKIKVHVPRSLRQFNVYTNHPQEANILLGDEKIAQVFAGFKNADSRGHPFLSLKILHGEVVLEFHSTVVYTPNRTDLINNVALMENYVQKLLLIVNKLKEIEQKKKE